MPDPSTTVPHDGYPLPLQARRVRAVSADPSSEALHDGYEDPSPRGTRRICGWCDGPIPPRARSDSIYCSTRCRQASARAGHEPSPPAKRYGCVRRSPLNAWEPVIYCGGRPYPSSPAARRLDALVAGTAVRTTDPRRCIGAKPATFAWWLFDLLGALPGDELVDLFPGSGGIGRAWSRYTASRLLPGEAAPSDPNGGAQSLGEPRPAGPACDGLGDFDAGEEAG